MDIINAIVNPLVAIADWFWGPPLVILIGVGGLYISLRLGFIQIRKFGYICTQTFGKMFSKGGGDGSVSPFAAACTALASSIGASNIVGVPVAIALGGPGAVFWIWVLAILGMATKYTEVSLGIKYRIRNTDGDYVGGPYYYCRDGVGGTLGKIMAVIFAFFLMIEIVPSIATQAKAATTQFVIYGVDERIMAGIVALIVVIVCIGGVKRIGSVCDKMVPFMALIYLAGALVIIVMNVTKLPDAIALIFKDAFTGQAAIGGFGGASAALAIRWGAARGVYSNEAGMGTAPIGHAAADVDHPIRQGMWGVFEVTVDTMIVCTITALSVLVSGAWISDGASKETGTLAQKAFASGFGGGFAAAFIAVCVFMFVLSTVIVITFYGERQAEFLFGRGFAKVWRWIYIVAIVVGGMGIEIKTLFSLTDFFLGIVIIPNMVAVIWLVPQVKKLQDEFFNTPSKYYMLDVENRKAKKAQK